MKAIIPVAGKGTRLYPLGIGTPKCMTKILNRPVVQWNIDALMENGINEIVLVISHDSAGDVFRGFINELLLQTRYHSLKVEFAVQKEKLGTGHVLQMVKDHFSTDERFVFINGDDIYSPDCIRDLLQHDLAALAREVDDPEKWGIFKTDANHHLIQLIEKPTEYIGNMANIGCYLLHSEIFNLFDQVKLSTRGEYEITDSISLLAKLMPIRAVTSSGYWHPIGYPWNILSVTESLIGGIESEIEGEIDPSVIIKGKVILPKSSKIKGFTHIEGNLIVGENTIIGPLASIRGDVVIGNNCKIAEGSEIKNSVLGDKCRTSQSYIGDSIFGNGINFPHSVAISSNNSFILDDVYSVETAEQGVKSILRDSYTSLKRAKFGAVIGDNCRISVGTKIRPGVKIWPNSTTSPGEVIRKDIINTW